MTYCEYLNTISGETLSLHKEYHTGFCTGYLPGAHSPECPIYQRIKQIKQIK